MAGEADESRKVQMQFVLGSCEGKQHTSDADICKPCSIQFALQRAEVEELVSEPREVSIQYLREQAHSINGFLCLGFVCQCDVTSLQLCFCELGTISAVSLWPDRDRNSVSSSKPTWYSFSASLPGPASTGGTEWSSALFFHVRSTETQNSARYRYLLRRCQRQLQHGSTGRPGPRSFFSHRRKKRTTGA